MATEFDIKIPEYCSDAVLAEKSPAMAEAFRTHGQAQAAPQPNQPNAWVAQEENVEFNGAAYNNAGSLGIQDLNPEPGSEAFFGIFAAVEKLACNVADSISGTKQPPPQSELAVSAPEPAPVNHFNRDFSGPNGPMGI